MFMVGSFASGLSEGLTKGFKLGTDIQESIYEAEREAALKKTKKGGGDGGLPAVTDRGVGAKPPSPTEPDPTGTGTSGGETFDPNHTLPPPKLENGRVPTAQPPSGPGLFPPEVLTRQPAALLPSTALPAGMPQPTPTDTFDTPDQYVPSQQSLPGRSTSPMPPVAAPPGTPTPRQQVQGWWNRNFAAPPVAPGTMVGGALPGRGNSAPRPTSALPPTPAPAPGPAPMPIDPISGVPLTSPPRAISTAPVTTAPTPSPPFTSYQNTAPIDPRTGQPYQQALY